MKKRVLAAMMACAMAAGLLSGCSSEPKNPGDSNEPVTTAAAGQTEAGDATAAAQEAVSYTHLDVYKRQVLSWAISFRRMYFSLRQ